VSKIHLYVGSVLTARKDRPYVYIQAGRTGAKNDARTYVRSIRTGIVCTGLKKSCSLDRNKDVRFFNRSP